MLSVSQKMNSQKHWQESECSSSRSFAWIVCISTLGPKFWKIKKVIFTIWRMAVLNSLCQNNKLEKGLVICHKMTLASPCRLLGHKLQVKCVWSCRYFRNDTSLKFRKFRATELLTLFLFPSFSLVLQVKVVFFSPRLYVRWMLL